MPEEKLQPPPYVGDSTLLARAFAYAREAHEGGAQRGGTSIAHPVAVAGILADEGSDDQVIAAALLHDVVEDTEHDEGDIGASFPPRVRRLVAVMTEDDSIEDYAERKAEHRARVLDAGRIPASIYLADKLARFRRYADDEEPVDPERLEHYRRTVAEYTEHDPSLPFLEELREELPRLRPAE